MLKNPKIYYNFFFGKHGQDFGSLFKRYYELFPEEADKLSPDLMDMYYGKNIQERCMKLLLTIKDKDNQITSKNINMINTIIVAMSNIYWNKMYGTRTGFRYSDP